MVDDNLLSQADAVIDRLESVSTVKVKKLLLNFRLNTLTRCLVVSEIMFKLHCVMFDENFGLFHTLKEKEMLTLFSPEYKE